MPATSLKQKRFMDAAAHNPEFAKEAGIPVGVAKEFSKASKVELRKFMDNIKTTEAKANGRINPNQILLKVI